MQPKLGSLILFSARLDAVVAFYRALGVPLESETHEDDGTPHVACDLDGVHLAVYESASGDAVRWREGGCTWPGFRVDDLAATLERVASSTTVLSGPEERPWGTRVVITDPDGRPVELWSAPA